jgi:hypothetical protein
MAGDEDGPAFARRTLEQVAGPADTVRIQPVDRLVEKENLRVAGQGGGHAGALGHPERKRPGPVAADGGEPGHLQHLAGPGSRDVVRLGQHLQVRPGASPGWMDRDSGRAPSLWRGQDISWIWRPVTVTSPLPGDPDP